MLLSLHTKQTVFALLVVSLLVPALGRSFQAYRKWAHKSKWLMDRPFQGYLLRFPIIKPCDPQSAPHGPESTHTVLLVFVGVFCSLVGLSAWPCFCLIGIRRNRIQSRVLRKPVRVINSTHSEFPLNAPPLAKFDDSNVEQHLISFKMKAGKASEPCGICLEPFGLVDVTAGQCSHVFHTAYMQVWLVKDGSQQLCPLCQNLFPANI